MIRSKVIGGVRNFFGLEGLYRYFGKKKPPPGYIPAHLKKREGEIGSDKFISRVKNMVAHTRDKFSRPASEVKQLDDEGKDVAISSTPGGPIDTRIVNNIEYKAEVLTMPEISKRRQEMEKRGIISAIKALKALDLNKKVYDQLNNIDKGHLHAAMHTHAFTVLPHRIILQALIYSQKTKLIKVFTSPELDAALEKLIHNLHNLKPTEVASLATFLNNSRKLEEKYFDPIYQYTIENASKLPLRSLTNILFAFSDITRKQGLLQDYLPLYQQCEVILAIHFRGNSEVKEQDLVGTTVAYSKAQAMSNEFRKILEQAYLDREEKLKPKSFVNLIHSFGLDSVRSNRIFSQTVQKLSHSPEDFDIHDKIMFANQSLKYFKDRHVREQFKSQVEQLQPPTLDDKEADWKTVELTTRLALEKVLSNSSELNTLDLKDLYSLLVEYIDQASQQFSVSAKDILNQNEILIRCFDVTCETFALFKNILTLADISHFVMGIHIAAEVETDKSIEFLRELKYRLKVQLKKRWHQGQIDAMKKQVDKIASDSLRETFAKILK